jgi:hypothetical protein
MVRRNRRTDANPTDRRRRDDARELSAHVFPPRERNDDARRTT